MELKEVVRVEKTNEEIIKKPESSNSKIKRHLNKIINSQWIIVIFIIITTLKTILFYDNTIYAEAKISMELIMKTVIFIATAYCILFILKNKTRFWVGFCINFLISILLFVDNIYYLYSNSVISIAQISNLQYTGEITNTLPFLLHINQILYFIDFVILIILMTTKIVNIIKIKQEKIFTNIACIILIIMLVPSVIQIALEDTAQHQYNKKKQIELGTIYAYHILDIGRNINIKKSAKYKNKAELLVDYNDLKTEYDNKYNYLYNMQNRAIDKNVIVLQLESMQQFLVDKKINGAEITPNLNKFLHENISFPNMYAQSYTTTADSEFSMTTSIYPMENGMSFAQYYSNKYDEIFGIFKNANYKTVFIHGNTGTFWNRNNVYSKMQVDNLIFDDVFPEGTERINGYISDEEVYKYIVQEMSEYDEKFFVNIVAASSHTGFGLDGIQNREDKVKIDVGEYKGTLFGRYLEAANYADYAFGVLINGLKQNNLYNDSVILVFGDHYGIGATNDELIDFLSKYDHEYNNIELELNFANILCGLRIPETESKLINTPVSKIDIKPTLTDICGLNDGFSFGVSMLKDKEFVCLNNEMIITDKYCYNGDWYDISTGNLICLDDLDFEEQNKLNEYYNYMKRELDMSVSISINNLLAE